MSNFIFNYQAEQVNKLCTESIDILTAINNIEIKNLIDAFNSFWDEYKQETKLTIAFIGQYNAGKSTLIKALTGNNSIKISAEICTDKVFEYAWQDVILLDTPGIYAGKTDHDEITLDRISKSDLLVFVIPNELFNPQGGAFFSKVANEMQRVGQILLVINKMSRESGSIEELSKNILQVIKPYSPNDFYTCFIDADSYLKATTEKDEEEKEFLLSESNFNDFVQALQSLIQKNCISARLATPLHRIYDILKQSLNLLNTGDRINHDIFEILRRKSVLITVSQTRFTNAYRGELNNLEHQITMLAENVASLIDGRHSEEEINIKITENEQEVNLISQNTLKKIQLDLENEITRLQQNLEELQNSALGRSLAHDFQISYVEGGRIDNQNIEKNFQISHFLGMGSRVFQELGNFTSSVSRKFIYKAGKFIGYKFKLFEAFKVAKFIRGLTPALAGLGLVLEVFVNVQQDQEEAEHERKLHQYRVDIRNSYQKVASEMKAEYEVNIEKQIIQNFYEQELWQINLDHNEVSQTEDFRSETINQINSKLQEINREIILLTK